MAEEDDEICGECGEPYRCPIHGDEMIHHDFFGMARCQLDYYGYFDPSEEESKRVRHLVAERRRLRALRN